MFVNDEYINLSVNIFIDIGEWVCCKYKFFNRYFFWDMRVLYVWKKRLFLELLCFIRLGMYLLVCGFWSLICFVKICGWVVYLSESESCSSFKVNKVLCFNEFGNEEVLYFLGLWL